MKKLFAFPLFISVVASLGFAHKDGESTLQSLITAERSFARMSEKEGIRPSFMAFIAEDGILFRPRAVKGKQWMIDHPLPPSKKRDLLKWQPSYADVARSGDMGYTFGPWEYKSDIKDAKPVAFGHFVTVWKKQTGGSWKFAVDLGISHPEPTEATVPWQLPKNYKQPPRGRMVNVESERAELLAREREFSKLSAMRGLQTAFLSNAATDVRLFREGKFPFSGKATAAEAIPTSAGVWTWQPQDAGVSRSGDLGYSYGTYNLNSGDATKPSETGNYLRIWKKQDGEWKVGVDLMNPVPEQQKN